MATTIEESDQLMPAATAFQRTPLVVAAGNLVAGPVHATFRDGDRESLLHSYLVLVRQLRGQQRAPSITLRGDDICAIADQGAAKGALRTVRDGCVVDRRDRLRRARPRSDGGARTIFGRWCARDRDR